MMRTARIPVSPVVAATALLASVATHIAVLAWRDLPDPIAIEGGGGAQMAMEGTAFADLARAAAPVRATAPAATSPRSEAAPSPPDPAIAAPNVADAIRPSPAAPAPEGAPRPASGIENAPSVAVPVAPEAATPASDTAYATPDAPPKATPAAAPEAATAVAIDPAPTPPVATAELSEAPPPEVEEIDAIEEMTPRLSARPRSRPEAIEARARAVAAARVERSPDSAPTPELVRQGNADRDARRGTAGGSEQQQAAASGAGRQQAAGNAAAANYPGRVRQQVSRMRQPRISARGTATIAFTVAANGTLASLGLARASGVARIDREAVDLIRRAAPFPPPPPGAQTSFTVPISWR
ncbi:TonB family protein [uncultured Jannaschia sp.]|uniref:TonB family protein n=1 Tax=uncultured Jannaschia sp. TaxID=293347 RepID=UPI0026051DD7|nr:TonB family protein [uncultured Jannaschia sp.]